MSVENAKALIAKAKEDKALAEKLKAAGNDGFEATAAEAGHPCTIEHFTEALKSSGDLDEKDLDKVAGGSPGNWPAPIHHDYRTAD